MRLLFALLILGSACDDRLPVADDGLLGERVDCAWLMSADSCVARVYAEVRACFPAVAFDEDIFRRPIDPAVLNADRTRCTYPDGTTVDFLKDPVPEIDEEGYPFSRYAFEVRHLDGGLCMSWDTYKHIDIELPGGRYLHEPVGDASGRLVGFNFHCPDGTVTHALWEELRNFEDCSPGPSGSSMGGDGLLSVSLSPGFGHGGTHDEYLLICQVDPFDWDNRE